jgi:hypothetical protein
VNMWYLRFCHHIFELKLSDAKTKVFMYIDRATQRLGRKTYIGFILIRHIPDEPYARFGKPVMTRHDEPRRTDYVLGISRFGIRSWEERSFFLAVHYTQSNNASLWNECFIRTFGGFLKAEKVPYPPLLPPGGDAG